MEISIVQASLISPKPLSTFHPQFTYPIFGDKERIFGYQGLRIKIRFAAHDLRPNVQVTYDKQFETVAETKATDIAKVLGEWMPSCKPSLPEHLASNAPCQNTEHGALCSCFR